MSYHIHILNYFLINYMQAVPIYIPIVEFRPNPSSFCAMMVLTKAKFIFGGLVMSRVLENFIITYTVIPSIALLQTDNLLRVLRKGAFATSCNLSKSTPSHSPVILTFFFVYLLHLEV